MWQALKALWVVFGLLMIAAASGRAENCPWLNAATAGGALGGTVTVKLAHTSPEDVTCEFTLRRGSDVATLEIAVHTMGLPAHDFQAYRSTCNSKATQLRGIGNEAAECTTTDQRGATIEQIVARVRNRAFLLKWTFPAAGGSIHLLPRDELQDTIRNLGEQVAGSLF